MAWTRTTKPISEIRGQAWAFTADHYLIREPISGFGEREAFDLNAPYQRGSVWTVEQRRALIRSFLQGITPAAIYYNALPFAEGRPSYRVIDGKQRIETIRAWVSGDLTVPADWFHDDDLDLPNVPADGMVTCAHLTKRGRRAVGGWSLPAVEVKLSEELTEHVVNGKVTFKRRRLSEDEILRAEARVYLLLNMGGTDQTDADLARAAHIAEAGA